MPRWRVLLEGRNFWLRVDGQLQRLGFYTTRFVDAFDEKAAELMAVQLIRDDPKLGEALNERSDPPMICVEQVTRVAVPDSEYANAGYTFYLEGIDA